MIASLSVLLDFWTDPEVDGSVFPRFFSGSILESFRGDLRFPLLVFSAALGEDTSGLTLTFGLIVSLSVLSGFLTDPEVDGSVFPHFFSGFMLESLRFESDRFPGSESFPVF